MFKGKPSQPSPSIQHPQAFLQRSADEAYPRLCTAADGIDDPQSLEAEDGGNTHNDCLVRERVEVRAQCNNQLHGSSDIDIDLLILLHEVRSIGRTEF